MVHSLAHERLVIPLSSTSTIKGIPGLILHLPCLVSFVASSSLRTENIWQRAPIRRPRSMMQRLVPRHGSPSSAHLCQWASNTDSYRCSCLIDGTADLENDWYVRSICFSPDGKLLVTGAEDNVIRVSTRICTRHLHHHHHRSRVEMLNMLRFSAL